MGPSHTSLRQSTVLGASLWEHLWFNSPNEGPVMDAVDFTWWKELAPLVCLTLMIWLHPTVIADLVLHQMNLSVLHPPPLGSVKQKIGGRNTLYPEFWLSIDFLLLVISVFPLICVTSFPPIDPWLTTRQTSATVQNMLHCNGSKN